METNNQHIIRGNKSLAAYFKVTDMTISKWKREGRLKFKQIGKVIIYDLTDLFTENHKQSSRKLQNR